MRAAAPTSITRLQVAYLWHGQVLGYRLLGHRDVLTVGPSKRATFVTPQLSGFPRRFKLLAPVRDGFRLRVGPGMSGQITQRGQTRSVGDVLVQPAIRRLLRDPGMFRETELYPGDQATVALDPEGHVRLQISYTDPPPYVGRPPLGRDLLLLRVGAGTSLSTLAALTFILLVGSRLPDPEVAITAERFAKTIAPVLEAPKMKAVQQKQKADAAEKARKRKEKEAAESKRMREKEGRLGRADAQRNETVIPKGNKDVLREKVAKTGLLAALGNAKAPGSGLGNLLTQNDSPDMEQALNGLAGAKLAVGKGAGGMGVAGSGLGGGGTGFGRIQGSGSLDVGAGRGRGRKGPGLGQGKEKEVQVGMTTGTADADGGLSAEQIQRVVRAHLAAVRYCYEKELQRQPNLSGKVDLFWVIRPNGTVDRTKIASSTLGSRPVESCIERQVKNWQFPKSPTETIVQKYPFFFKGGA